MATYVTQKLTYNTDKGRRVRPHSLKCFIGVKLAYLYK